MTARDIPNTRQSAADQFNARLLVWLTLIGEFDEECIGSVVQQCRTDAAARDYFGAQVAAQLDSVGARMPTKVTAMLDSNPCLRIAVRVADPDSGPVVMEVGIREIATFEMEIPLAKYDPITLLELLARHGHAMEGAA